MNRLVVQGKVNTPCKCTKILEAFCKQRVAKGRINGGKDQQKPTTMVDKTCLVELCSSADRRGVFGEAREGWRDVTM